MTGGLAAVVDIGGFGLLHAWGLQIMLAASLSFTIAAVVNYQLSSRYVFGGNPNQRQFYQFFVVALIGMAINVSLTIWLLHHTALYPIVAKLIAVGITFVVNFLLVYFIVFKEKKSA